MKTGKVPEAVLKRSVLRKLHKDISIQCREYYGSGCASVCPEDGRLYVSVCAVPGFEQNPGMLALAAANSLWAGGAVPEALTLQAVLPAWYEEAALQQDMEQIAAGAEAQGMRVIGGHTQVSTAVNRPLYTVTGIGRYETAGADGSISGGPDRRALRPGDSLVLTKWIGLGGTAALAAHYEQELKQRYPDALIDRAREFEKLMSAAREARAAGHFGPAAVHDLSQGGVFGALWEMAEHAGVGLEVDLKKIPIRQETVEVCEYFDVNPYELYSGGALLVGTEHGELLVRELAQCGIPAAVIGQATDGRDRRIQNGEDSRCLDRPKQDEWYRLVEQRMPGKI